MCKEVDNNSNDDTLQSDNELNLHTNSKEMINMSISTAERYCTVAESIEESCKQIQEFKQGKRKLKSLKESRELWKKWASEVEDSQDE